MARLCSAILVVVGLLVSVPAPAGAQEFPPIPFPIDDGGSCTGVPDALPGIFDFSEACAAHDQCYAAGVQSRQACDLAFQQDMVAACQAQHPDPLDARRYVCLVFAQLYFLGVTLFGPFV